MFGGSKLYFFFVFIIKRKRKKSLDVIEKEVSILVDKGSIGVAVWGGGTVTYQVTVIFHNVISIFKLVKFEASHNMKDISRIIEGQYLLPCIILSAAWDRWTLSDIWHGSC